MHDPLSLLSPKEAAVIPETANAFEAVKKMNEFKQGCVLIQDKAGHLKGIVTERDILFKTTSNGTDLKKIKVTQIMTANVEILTEDSNLALALHQMSVKRLRHIPVTCAHGNTKILSARDLLKHVAKHL